MIKIILKAFLFILAVGFLSVSHAQQSTTVLTGEWVGNSEPSGRSEFLRLSLTENAGEMLRPLKAKLTSVQFEGSRVRLELSSLKLVMTGTIAGDEIEGEAEVPGTKARFHLVRTVKVAPEILTRYLGAYRFRNGDYLVIDTFPDTPDTLFVTDVKSGQVRAVFPRWETRSQTKFTAGPALYVASPTRQTLTFRGAGVDVVDLDNIGRKAGAYAARVPIAREEVTFKNGDVTLAGTLLLPASKGKHPVVVFTHGGGVQFREVMWGLGYLYAARGFAVLSYDKRGVGKSTGNWRESSFEDLADDAVAAAKFLQSRNEVAPTKSAFGVLARAGGLLRSRLHVFRTQLLRSLCEAAGCHPRKRSCLIPSTSCGKRAIPRMK